jgi:hypothetical protein
MKRRKQCAVALDRKAIGRDADLYLITQSSFEIAFFDRLWNPWNNSTFLGSGCNHALAEAHC